MIDVFLEVFSGDIIVDMGKSFWLVQNSKSKVKSGTTGEKHIRTAGVLQQ